MADADGNPRDEQRSVGAAVNDSARPVVDRTEINRKKRLRRQAKLEQYRASERAYAVRTKEHQSKIRKEWKKKNADKIRAQENARLKFRYKNDPEFRAKILAYHKNKYRTDPKWRAARIASGYKKKSIGVSREQRNAMIEAQGGLCAICGDPLPIIDIAQQEVGSALTMKSRFSTDHCHKTGIIRGILHNKCNILLGHANEDIRILKCAIAYLEKFQPPPVRDTNA